MATKIQLRKGIAALWTEKNPVLLAGEAGVETDTHTMKVGDGSTAWNDLPYTGSEGVGGGPSFLSGSAVPTTVGSEGDFYLCTTTLVLYGPKTSGVWPVVGDLNDDVIGGPGGDSEVVWTLPDVDGEPGQVLGTDGFGNLEWVSVPSFLIYDTNAAYTGVAAGGFGSYFDYRMAKAGDELTISGAPMVSIDGNWGQLPNFIGWNTKADGTGVYYYYGDTLTMPLYTVILYAQVGSSSYY